LVNVHLEICKYLNPALSRIKPR